MTPTGSWLEWNDLPFGDEVPPRADRLIRCDSPSLGGPRVPHGAEPVHFPPPAPWDGARDACCSSRPPL